VQPFGVEFDFHRPCGSRQRDRKSHCIAGCRYVHDLPFPRQHRRQITYRNVFDQNAEQAFPQMTRQSEFIATPFRRKPRARDQEQHRFAAIRRIAQRIRPTLACLDASFGIEIEKDVVPTCLRKPARKRERLRVILAGVAEKDDADEAD
jgi:hypothetical protein